MLPFTKRSARGDEAPELINTGDIEVVRQQKNASSFPSPPADRPRVFSRSVPDDEMTTLMPRKGVLAQFTSRLPQAMTPRSTSTRPKPVLMEEPTQAFVRPPAAPAPSAPPPALPKPNMRHMTRPAPRQEIAPQSLAPVAMTALPAAKQDSDAKIDPPATVITTRTRIITPRPTVSWAAALVAMGVFVGLVTAVIARGDADSLIDATASFVDPSGSHAAGSANGAIASLQSKFDPPTRSYMPLSDSAAAPAKDDEPKSVALNDLPTASPQPQKAAPVAYAAPARAWRPAWRPARPAPVAKAPKEPKEAKDASEEKVAAAPKATAPASKHAAAGAPAKGASDDDVESASAADALAKAQLEASLK